MLDEHFTKLLDQLRFDDDVLAWVSQALRASHQDEKQHHEEAIRHIRENHDRLQSRIDNMYVDKLDGRIAAEFFDRKASEWREEQEQCLQAIHDHQSANRTYIDEGVQLLELAQRAGELFRKQPSTEKRRLLGFVLSNCTWRDGKLSAEYRQPFDLLAKNVISIERDSGADDSETDVSEKWLRRLGSNQ